MPSAKLKSSFETAGEMNKHLANIAVEVLRGDIKVAAATVSVKACEVIVANNYSQAKIAALAQMAGHKVYSHGQLPLNPEPDANVI